MPQYKSFQYSIKQYGKFNSEIISKNSKLTLLKCRIGIKRGNEIEWIYSSAPTIIIGKQEKLRITSNTGERITESSIKINQKLERIRIKTNNNKEYIYSERGWG